MTSPYETIPLYPLANPRSIAFFGASNRYTAMGTNQLNSILALGFEGAIYPIHPSESTVLGMQAYQDVQALPEVPDLAVLVMPTRLVAETLAACGRKGIRHAIVVSGGFKEVGGDGVQMEADLVAVARRHGMRFIGPNCLGVVNPHHRFNVTFANFEGRPGFIGMASQSGSLLTQMFRYLEQFQIGFSTGISVGNEADVDLVDCLEYLAACPHTRVITLYIETIRRGRRFIDTARRIAARKPIVAFYAGGSEAGRRAAFSHTGAMAGPDRLYDGVFAQSGIVRADSLTELFDFAWVLGQCAIPQGNRVIVQTHSGGPGAAAADACSRNGLSLPPFAPETLAKLRPLIPHTGSMNNPVDLTFSRDPMEYFRSIPEVLLQEPGADSMLLYCFTPRKNVMRIMQAEGLSEEEALQLAAQMAEEHSRKLADLVRQCGKPLLGFSYQNAEELIIRKILESGIPILPSPERAARALWALVHYGRIQAKLGA
ncbi:acetate--CoA ligase family protein [Desulfatitalea alkaliphila]|uniref:CoA-binding protein n=1 Tax=Desulfatitalea alkaliphila TaxID=2929485 RepID=A0AA41ULC2_9BACT|nr:CoA-binding protein [Desulfatitalea alkaliphila]MCJ8502302.1 CoA-binding protein [Desulfatitalea alkaliphila]